MANLPPNMGKEIELETARSMDAYVEGNRVRIGTKFKDGSILYIWMSKLDFQMSLSLLHLAARTKSVWQAARKNEQWAHQRSTAQVRPPPVTWWASSNGTSLPPSKDSVHNCVS